MSMRSYWRGATENGTRAGALSSATQGHRTIDPMHLTGSRERRQYGGRAFLGRPILGTPPLPRVVVDLEGLLGRAQLLWHVTQVETYPGPR